MSATRILFCVSGSRCKFLYSLLLFDPWSGKHKKNSASAQTLCPYFLSHFPALSKRHKEIEPGNGRKLVTGVCLFPVHFLWDLMLRLRQHESREREKGKSGDWAQVVARAAGQSPSGTYYRSRTAAANEVHNLSIGRFAVHMLLYIGTYNKRMMKPRGDRRSGLYGPAFGCLRLHSHSFIRVSTYTNLWGCPGMVIEWLHVVHRFAASWTHKLEEKGRKVTDWQSIDWFYELAFRHQSVFTFPFLFRYLHSKSCATRPSVWLHHQYEWTRNSNWWWWARRWMTWIQVLLLFNFFLHGPGHKFLSLEYFCMSPGPLSKKKY